MLQRTLSRLLCMFPFITEQRAGHYLVSVHAKPGARASAFAGVLTAQNTEVDLRIAAPPVEGQANAELLRFLDEVIEAGLTELQSDPVTFLEGTSYAHVVAAAAASPAVAEVASSGEKKAKKKPKGKGSVPIASATPLPERVEVSLVRGGTSREKTVLVLFPGTRAQLLAVLEKASQS